MRRDYQCESVRYDANSQAFQRSRISCSNHYLCLCSFFLLCDLHGSTNVWIQVVQVGESYYGDVHVVANTLVPYGN